MARSAVSGDVRDNERQIYFCSLAGLHNWIRFYDLERNASATNFDYRGFLVKRGVS